MSRRRLAAVATAAVTALASTAAQSPTFSARVEAVRLDVLVTDNGQPVRGLTPPDFQVLDNDVLQAVDLVSYEQIPLSVVMTLDVSASVMGERLDNLREASRAVLDALQANDRAALVVFNQALTEHAALTEDVARLRSAVDALEPSGDTALTDGAYAGLTIADGSPGRGLLIVFSDGSDTASWLREDAVVEAAKRSEPVIYAVSAGARNASFLRDLTTSTGGRLYQVESTRNLRAVFLAALEEFRQRYLVSYTPRGVQRTGWHRVEVKVKGRHATVRARPGYFGGS